MLNDLRHKEIKEVNYEKTMTISDIAEHILCWKVTGIMPPVSFLEWPTFTILTDIDGQPVTCQRCLELIHA